MAKVELKQPVVAEIAELFNGAKGEMCIRDRRKCWRKLVISAV